jgi:hypothetical protein
LERSLWWCHVDVDGIPLVLVTARVISTLKLFLFCFWEAFVFSRSSQYGNTASMAGISQSKSERTFFLRIGRRRKLLDDKKLTLLKAVYGGYLSLAASSLALLYLPLIQNTVVVNVYQSLSFDLTVPSWHNSRLISTKNMTKSSMWFQAAWFRGIPLRYSHYDCIVRVSKC